MKTKTKKKLKKAGIIVGTTAGVVVAGYVAFLAYVWKG